MDATTGRSSRDLTENDGRPHPSQMRRRWERGEDRLIARIYLAHGNEVRLAFVVEDGRWHLC